MLKCTIATRLRWKDCAAILMAMPVTIFWPGAVCETPVTTLCMLNIMFAKIILLGDHLPIDKTVTWLAPLDLNLNFFETKETYLFLVL